MLPEKNGKTESEIYREPIEDADVVITHQPLRCAVNIDHQSS